MQRLFLVFFLLIHASAISQQKQVFHIPADTISRHRIPDSLIRFHKGGEGRLTLNDIQKLSSNGQLGLWESRFKKDIGSTDHWFTFALGNNTPDSMEVGLAASSDLAIFYIVYPDGRTDSLVTGNRLSWNKKTFFKNENIVVFNLPGQGVTTVFYHALFKSDVYQSRFEINVVKPDRILRSSLSNIENTWLPKDVSTNNFFAGFFMMTALVYFIFFWGVRERVFLFFGLFVLVLAVSCLQQLFEIALADPDIGDYGIMIAPLCVTLFTLFFRQYLNTPHYLPRWDKLLIFYVLFFGAITFIDLFLIRSIHVSAIVNWFLISTTILLLITPFLMKGVMKREKKILFYAALPFVGLVIISTLLILALYSHQVREGLRYNSLFLYYVRNQSVFVLLAFLWLVLSFSRVLIRRFTEQRDKIRQQELEKEQMALEREKERAHLMEKQKAELEKQVAERTAELRRSLEELKNAQAQLIQSEKMASLGEMTAGIAHEIQNPLNFVNNFAEVNKEITEELQEELMQLIPEADKRKNVEALLEDLAGNQEKIRHHGKRADNIVKNMLQHSRKGTEQKEPVDLNNILDEYMKLSFHGLRARDKTFNADFSLEADPAVGKISILTQDFGRVILNLVNNAFYAVNEKKKIAPENYQPQVIITTRKEADAVMITISDNGTGIPEKVRDKIFQPFFTTKPTGEGTGLGLSISYDIITKGHGGSMTVNSKEGEGSTFTITLPA